MCLAMIGILQFGERLTSVFGGLFPVSGRDLHHHDRFGAFMMYGVVGGLIVSEINPYHQQLQVQARSLHLASF